ncbi:MAG: thymidine phosphorylase [Clostridia bacterium]|nr:thymidine phosphorylase [Clostridia bacterium]
MTMYEIIQKKKEEKVLSKEEISFFVQGFTRGEIPDYQAAALMMAICFSGMNEEETAILTEEMMYSGDVLDLTLLVGACTVDKHSTGGVGDKTTLILAPIVASCGAVVAKMSGRGLGHTGGTVDKMESVPGMKTSLPSESFFKIAKEIGICVVGQSGNFAPADKKMYALRDVTATVNSIPLIASSIMSKKLASGAENIVLDVKYGSGAFMKTPEEAKKLAETMVSIGKRLGRKVSALVTDMDSPLGTHIGNALEVKEAVTVLQGKGDAELTRLCLILSSHMLSLAKNITPEEGRKLAEDALFSGKAFDKMKQWFSHQGGDIAFLDDPSGLSLSAYSCQVLSEKEGYLSKIKTDEIGLSAGELGAGRKTKEDQIDFGAGIVLHKKIGDFVKKGEAIATFYASNESLFPPAKKRFLSALDFSQTPPEKKKLIYDIVE